MSSHNKVRHFPLLASMLGKRYGVEVVFAGNQPCTTGKRIVLPALPEDLNDEEMMLLVGHLDHEAGAHGRYLDFAEYGARCNKGIAKDIKNILADVHDERLLGRDFPGCRNNLRESLDIMDRRGILKFDTDTAPAAFLGWLFHVAYAANAQFPKAVQEHPAAVRNFLSDTALARIQFEVEQAVDEPDTAGVLNRTENILKILKEEEENPTPPQQPQQGQDQPQAGDSDAGSKDDSPGSDSSAGGDDPGNAGNPTGDQDSGGAGAASQNGSGNSSQPGTGNSDGTASAPSGNKNASDSDPVEFTRQQIREILEAAYSGAGDFGQIIAEEIGATIGNRGAGPQGITVPGVTKFHKRPLRLRELDILKRTTAQLRGKTAALIQATRHKPATTALTGRRIDRKALCRTAVGNMRIFEHREPRKEVNTAIVILGDASASMVSGRIVMASQGCFISSEAMRAIPGTSTLVAAFPANGGNSSDLGVLKGWNDMPKPLQPIADGDWTPIAEALQWARVQLAFRKEERKLVLILTDGESSDDERTKAAVRDLEKDGIELIVIGIQCDLPGNWTNRYRRIDDITDLPSAMIDLLREQLVGTRHFRKSA